jgi:hypothetical protein
MTGEFDSNFIENGRGLIRDMPSIQTCLQSLRNSTKLIREYGRNSGGSLKAISLEYKSANLPLETTWWWFRQYKHYFSMNKTCKQIK